MSTGLHPWHVNNFSSQALLYRLKLNCENKRVIAIGEIGLDKHVGNYEKQESYFGIQLAFAATFHYPVILHQVKSVEGIGSMTRDFKEPIILHGFTQHLSVWEQLNKNGKTYISLGSNVMNPSTKLLQTIQEIPLDNLFIETDAASVLVQTVYEKIAQIKKMETGALQIAISRNFERVFNRI